MTTFNPDDILKDIQANMEPREEEISAQDKAPEDFDDDECIYCSRDDCENSLNFPIFPNNHYFLKMTEWIETMVLPAMQMNRCCFPCVLKWVIFSGDPRLNLVDITLSQTLLRELPGLLTLPQGCVHAQSYRRVVYREPTPEELEQLREQENARRPNYTPEQLEELRQRAQEAAERDRQANNTEDTDEVAQDN